MSLAFIVKASHETDSLINVIGNTFGDTKLEAQAELSLKIVLINPDSAISLANNTIFSARWNQSQIKGICYLSIGEAYSIKKDYKQALIAYGLAHGLFANEKDSVRLAQLSNSIGLLHYYRAEYDSAMIFFQRSLNIEKKLNNKLGVAKSHQNIALILYQLNDMDRFFEHNHLAKNIYEQINDVKHVADVANNMAIAYSSMADYPKSFDYYTKALNGYERIRDTLHIANVFTNLGSLFFYQKDYNRSLEYLTQAREYFDTLRHNEGILYVLTRMGDVFFEMGDSEKAMEKYLECETLNKTLKNKDIRLQNLKSLINVYKVIKDYEGAFRVSEMYYLLKDSIFNEEKFRTIYEIEKKYEQNNASRELQALVEKNRSRTMLYLAVAIAVLAIIAILILFNRQKQIEKDQRLINLEQQVLRTQMSPHFLFNALSAIQYFVLENKTIEAIDFIGDFSKLIRLVLQSSQEEFITLETEQAILNNYLNLLSKRYDNKIKYIIHFDDNIDLKNTLVPPMLAQPFIENVIEHGDLGKRNEGNIWISFSVENKRLKFRIQDDGIGIEKSMEKRAGHSRASVAISITRKRLQLINKGNIEKQVDLVIEDLSKFGKSGTLVEFSIPYQKLK
ncbi:MAG: histidine kinase [Marinilabiliaceae bacterium]|nr:histidine kinase [Marinilabiliaceae bacterium]